MRSPVMLFIAFFAALTGANAAELGRLFYTPQQRAQLETRQTTGHSVDSGKRNFIMVNGVIQKQGGSRIVWINGTQQPAAYGNEKTPASVTVNVPGKSQPVHVKVGQRLLLNTPAQDETGENKSEKTVPAKPVEDDD